MMNRKGACLVALLFGASLLRGEIMVLRNFTLIDGSRGQPLAGAAMIVDAGRIVWVGPLTQLKAPAGAEMVDLTGKYVMPGIINLVVRQKRIWS
jgi:imidazolonepropionase-like amidohydrolase